jgi:hypothetical protein
MFLNSFLFALSANCLHNKHVLGSFEEQIIPWTGDVYAGFEDKVPGNSE